MKNFVLFSIVVAGALCAFESSAQSASHAYIIDADYSVRYVSSKGGNESKSAANFALKVSVGADGSVWVVSTDQGKLDQGGNLLKMLPKGKTNWVTVHVHSGAEAVAVSADVSGGAWMIDGQTHEIVQISSTGDVLSVTETGPYFEVSASFSNDTSTSQIWSIGSEPNENIGNPVYYMFPSDGQWKSRGVGAQALSGYWTVTSDGQIVTAASDSSTHVLGPRGTASSISVGNSGSIWVISLDANIEQGGAYLKIWNQQGSAAANWVKVPNIGARSVSVE